METAMMMFSTERQRTELWLQSRIMAAKSSGKAIMEETLLTPILAEMLMEMNVDNRPLNKTLLRRMVSDITDDRWELNGNTIVISKDGLLNDGQHRCSAVLATGKAIPLFIIFGVDRHTRMTVDTGAVKTVGHFIGMKGHANAKHMATIAHLIWLWEKLEENGGRLVNSRGRLCHSPTKAESLALADKYSSEMTECLAFVDTKNKPIASKPVLAFTRFIIMKAGADTRSVDYFFTRLISGDNLELTNPILMLRNKLIDLRGVEERAWNTRVEYIIRAWNYYRRNIQPKSLRLADTIPEILE